MVDEAFASRLAGNSDVVWRAAAAVSLVNALAADSKVMPRIGVSESGRLRSR